MADTINHTWQTVELAAVTLNVSTRTIARRIAGGTIESRVDENGRRLVLVETYGTSGTGDNDESANDGSGERQTSDVGQDIHDNALAVAGASSLATPVGGEKSYGPAAGSILAVLQGTIDAARTDAARARTGARWAWAGVAAMAVVIAAGGMIFINRLTRAETRVEMLQDNVATIRTDLTRSQNDLQIVSSAKAVADEKRIEAEKAVADAAAKQKEAELQLAVARQAETAAKTATVAQRIEKSPATQPALLSRFVNLPLDK